jgi:hypothetical protein
MGRGWGGNVVLRGSGDFGGVGGIFGGEVKEMANAARLVE